MPTKKCIRNKGNVQRRDRHPYCCIRPKVDRDQTLLECDQTLKSDLQQGHTLLSSELVQAAVKEKHAHRGQDNIEVGIEAEGIAKEERHIGERFHLSDFTPVVDRNEGQYQTGNEFFADSHRLLLPFYFTPKCGTRQLFSGGASPNLSSPSRD
jgi:hypothetical protein